jgi:alkylation response protein AidB-like acyl-CoA dehydrogenase
MEESTEMEFGFTEEQNILKANARRFMENEIAPYVEEEEKRGTLSRERAGFFIKKLLSIGYISGPFPTEFGGMGIDELSHAIMTEELWRIWPSLGVVALVDPAPANWALSSGDRELMERFIPPILKGEKIGCGAITEPNVGSNPREIQTTAIRDGDHYILNGTKTWITNGGIADLVLCVCKIKDEPGLNLLIVDKEVSPFRTRELHKLGLRSSPTSEIHFEDCIVPASNRVGAPGAGLKETLKRFEGARATLAIGAVGISQASLEAAIKYAGQRRQWGKTISGHQTIQHMIAEMDTLTDASRFLAYRAFYMIDKGVRAARETSMAKYYCCECAIKVSSMAIQIHGAYGLSDEFPVERYFRDARTLTIPDGTSEIQKLIVARELLKVSAF